MANATLRYQEFRRKKEEISPQLPQLPLLPQLPQLPLLPQLPQLPLLPYSPTPPLPPNYRAWAVFTPAVASANWLRPPCNCTPGSTATHPFWVR